jgi:hypothetical protein
VVHGLDLVQQAEGRAVQQGQQPEAHGHVALDGGGHGVQVGVVGLHEPQHLQPRDLVGGQLAPGHQFGFLDEGPLEQGVA